MTVPCGSVVAVEGSCRRTYGSNETFFLHDFDVDSVEGFEVIKEDHVKLEWFGHVECFSQ
jgi:hypothetical protein